MKKTKLHTLINFNTPYQKEVPCYWELEVDRAVLRHWNTHEILSTRKHWGL